jgi:hypothetical protein
VFRLYRNGDSQMHNIYFTHHSYMFQPPQHSHNQAVHRITKKEIIYIKGMGEIVALQKKLHISIQVYKHILLSVWTFSHIFLCMLTNFVRPRSHPYLLCKSFPFYNAVYRCWSEPVNCCIYICEGQNRSVSVSNLQLHWILDVVIATFCFLRTW